jgi:hypothetical protein
MKRTTRPAPQRFQATIYRIWMMRHVDVPEDVAQALEKEFACGSGAKKLRKHPRPAKPKYVPVVAMVNGKSARMTLVPAGGGRYRMQINTALRKAAHADVGDVVGIELRLDLSSRTLPVPPDLRASLKPHPRAWKAFEALTPGHRRHFIEWFDSAKSAEARGRRLDRAIDVLLERALLRPSKL